MLKTLGQFENLGFVIMSTRENIRLIARAPYQDGQQISMYLSFILDKLILIAPAIMHLLMVSTAYIRDMQQTQFKMHHCM